MLNSKYILSLGIITALSISTSALAFQAATPLDAPSNIIYVSNSSIKDSAQEFISTLTKSGLGILESTDTSEDIRQEDFRKLLHDNFDMKTIARFALGRYWRTSTDKEKKEYLELFENMIIAVYSKRFSNYNGQAINVISSRNEGKSDAIVLSTITPDSGAEIAVTWRVRKKKDGQLKVIDIIVQGVSMSLTQRSDFASVIQRGGGKIEVLLAHLRP